MSAEQILAIRLGWMRLRVGVQKRSAAGLINRPYACIYKDQEIRLVDAVSWVMKIALNSYLRQCESRPLRHSFVFNGLEFFLRNFPRNYLMIGRIEIRYAVCASGVCGRLRGYSCGDVFG